MFLISCAQMVGKPVSAPEPTAAAAPFRAPFKMARRVGWRRDLVLDRWLFIVCLLGASGQTLVEPQFLMGQAIVKTRLNYEPRVETRRPSGGRDPRLLPARPRTAIRTPATSSSPAPASRLVRRLCQCPCLPHEGRHHTPVRGIITDRRRAGWCRQDCNWFWRALLVGSQTAHK